MDRDRVGFNGDRLRICAGGPFQSATRRYVGLCRGCLRQGRLFPRFLLYFLSLAIGNVAIAISAVGYLAGFFPWLSSTPIATCIGVIALLWLTTVANFGGPELDRPDRLGNGLGSDHSGRLLSIIGWFWFSTETFAAAWNPHGLKLAQGMGSSIALTLWAFLGMESAAQNSAAVENPKRDVPLACMFGTLGAAVIYILSTTVIQGIVPNAELAAPLVRSHLPMPRCSTRRWLTSSWRSQSWLALARCWAGSSPSHRPANRRRTSACSPPSSPR